MNIPLENIIIRKARPSDAERIVGLLNPIIEKGTDSVWDLPCTAEFERHWLENLRPGSIYSVAERRKDSKIVGIQTLTPMLRYYKALKHIANMMLFVDLDERGKGIGTFLANETFREARNNGYENVHLYIREDNFDSLLFAFKLGFRIIGIAKNHAKCYSKYVDMVVLERFLQ